ncbi:hypothetical protein RIF29_27255 [Crotalaria pallida]|uniref:HTH myb-type domain-containing protein n=1 Tax=Crotalaria pallida TaxID=3830 RepID=A0AAN9EPP2_CROPI
MMNKKKDEKKKKVVRLSWSQELHDKFVVAVNLLGFEKATPKRILELMNDGKLTLENVSSHLQKYKLHLKKQSSCVAKANQQVSVSAFDRQFHNCQIASASHHSDNNAQNLNDSANDQLQFQSASTDLDCEVIFSTLNDTTNQQGHSMSTNSTFNEDQDFNFGDFLQLEDNKIMELTDENLVESHQVYDTNQLKSRNSCIASSVGSPEDLGAASSSSCNRCSQQSAEIAKLRQEMAATREESRQMMELVRGMIAKQNMFMQAVLYRSSHPMC